MTRPTVSPKCMPACLLRVLNRAIWPSSSVAKRRRARDEAQLVTTITACDDSRGKIRLRFSRCNSRPLFSHPFLSATSQSVSQPVTDVATMPPPPKHQIAREAVLSLRHPSLVAVAKPREKNRGKSRAAHFSCTAHLLRDSHPTLPPSLPRSDCLTPKALFSAPLFRRSRFSRPSIVFSSFLGVGRHESGLSCHREMGQERRYDFRVRVWQSLLPDLSVDGTSNSTSCSRRPWAAS